MAQKTIIELTDDLDGGSADETAHFGLDGVEYEIDLSAANAQRLRSLLAEFTEAGRRVRKDGSAGKQRKAAVRSGSSDREHKRAARQWAQLNFPERKLGDRGRLPKDILEAFEAAHGGVGATNDAVAPSVAGQLGDVAPVFADAGV